MRFARLHFLKYGNFDDRELRFPKAERDFQLIIGQNEAGKTTALDAVTDLLFGFPHAKTQHYRFDANLLRVGAEIENGNETIEIQRKRGKTGTLLGLSDQVLQESVVQEMLFGLTRETYRLAWSLNHKHLREGGESIAEAKDDVGQALFSAGTGLAGIPQALNKLDDEADSIWKSRGRTGTWNIAHNNYQSAVETVKDKSVRPREWTQAKELVEGFEREKKTLEENRRELQGEQRKIQRLRRVIPLLHRLRNIERELDGCTTPPLSETQESSFFHLQQALSNAERDLDKCDGLISSQEEQLKGLQQDPQILEREQTIQELVEDRGAVREWQRDLPKRDAELAQQLKETINFRRELGLQTNQTIDEILPSLPTHTQIARIRERLTKLTRLEELTKAATDHEKSLKSKESNLKANAVGQPGPELAVLDTVVKQARKAGRLDSELDSAEIKVAGLVRSLENKMAQLRPWEGDLEQLRRIQIPSEAIVEKYRKRLEGAEREREDEEKRGIALQDDEERGNLRRVQLLQSQGAITAGEVSGVRERRDQAWGNIRNHLRGETIISEVAPVIEEFEARVKDADGLADERYFQSEASAQLTELDDTLENLRLQRQQHQRRLVQAENALIEANEAWDSETTSRNLPQLPPLQLREWLAVQSSVLSIDSDLEVARGLSSEARRNRDEGIAQLCRSLPNGKELTPPPHFYAEALEYVEGVLTELLEQKNQHDRYSGELTSIQSELEDASRLAAEAIHNRELQSESLTAALTEAGLSDAPDLQCLDLYDQLRNKAESSQDLAHRVNTMIENSRKFNDSVFMIARAFGLPEASAMELLEKLKTRLDTAKAEQQKASQIATAIDNANKERLQAQKARESAEEDLSDLAAAAGTKDPSLIEKFVSRSREIRSGLNPLKQVQAEALKAGDGPGLNALLDEAEKADPETTDKREQELEDDISEIDDRVTDVAQQLGEARTSFNQIDTGTAAVDAAADAELSRGQMDQEAETYLLKKAQAVLLRWTLQRNRQSGQSPVLVRASKLFEQLTIGRYSGLTADTEEGTPKLVGVSRDGDRTVPFQAMSDGTKDQLYLSLRIALIEQSLANGVVLPFIADDLFINYDDERARAGLEVLADLSRSTQVLFLTHHAHIKTIAGEVLGKDALHTCEL